MSLQRRKRFALKRNVSLVRRSIGQTLADDALGQLVRAVGIVYAERNAVVVAEIELREITVQMLFGTMLVGPAHTALEY